MGFIKLYDKKWQVSHIIRNVRTLGIIDIFIYKGVS